jgi:hypothetical protein
MFLCFLNKALFVALKFLSVSLCVGALPWSMTDLPTLCAASPAFVRAGLGEMAELAALETGAGLNTGFVGAGFYEMAQLATLETGVLFFVAAFRAEIEGRALFFLGAEPGEVASAVADEAAASLANLKQYKNMNVCQL